MVYCALMCTDNPISLSRMEGMVSADNKPVPRHDSEETYKEFERIRGFDIRTHHAPDPGTKTICAVIPGGKVVTSVVDAGPSTAREPYDFTRTRVEDTRDARDPEGIGTSLLNRPADTSILEWADNLEAGR